MKTSHVPLCSTLLVCLFVVAFTGCDLPRAAPPPSPVDSPAPEMWKETLKNQIATLNKQYGNVDSRILENRQRIETLEKELIALRRSVRTISPAHPPSPEARKLYHTALEAYFRGDYMSAISRLQEFLNAFPHNDLTDNAFYWTGESYYAQKDFQRAISSFSELVDSYPHANNVPEALFKIGLSYTQLKNLQKAREFFTYVMDNYPFSEAAKKAKTRLFQLD